MTRATLAIAYLGAVAALAAACGGESTEAPGAGGTAGSGSGSAGKAGASSGGSAGAGGASSGRSGSSGASSSGTGGSTGGGSGVGGSTGGSADGGSGVGGDCPASPPAQGSSCTMPTGSSAFDVAHCSWGSDPRPECRTGALCSETGWQVTEPEPSRCSAPPLPPECPATPPEMGTQCADEMLRCWYEDGTHCECSPCRNGSAYPICQTIDPPEWTCGTPPAGCPNPLPQAGEACDEPELSCGPSCEQPVRCQDGSWHWGQVECPICAAPDTPIATPAGERPIADLRVGELVYSVDDAGIVAVPIARIGSTPVSEHRAVRVVLEAGTVLEISPGHPTADGRLFSALRAGDELAPGHPVVSAEVVPYRYHRTYDILPASSSGAYFAGGALIGSTLAR